MNPPPAKRQPGHAIAANVGDLRHDIGSIGSREVCPLLRISFYSVWETAVLVVNVLVRADGIGNPPDHRTPVTPSILATVAPTIGVKYVAPTMAYAIS
jgi:hypothetical protein